MLKIILVFFKYLLERERGRNIDKGIEIDRQ